MDNKTRYTASVASIFFFVIFPCLLLILTGVATPFIDCFSVDHLDRLYIGAESEIRVYEDGKQIKSIGPQTSKSYMFTIQEDNTILLSTATEVYTMDLDGNILSVREDPGADMFNQLQYRKRIFVSKNKDTYRLKNYFTWTSIEKNGAEVVYKISGVSFAVKVVIVSSIMLIIALTIRIAVKSEPDEDSTPWSSK
jgi:hypothetical protein